MAFALGHLQRLNEQFPGAQIAVLTLIPSLSQRVEEPFQFPSNPHPLAKFAKMIQTVRQNPSNVEGFKNAYNALDNDSKNLFTDKKIEVFMRNSHQLLRLLSQPDCAAYEQLDLFVKQTLAKHIYDLSKDPQKSSWGWGGGERHALDDAQCLKDAVGRLVEQDVLGAYEEKIRAFAVQHYQKIPDTEKGSIHGSVYHIAGRPRTSDSDWGRNNAMTDTARLVSALHCNAKIPGPLTNASFLKSWENEKTAVRSQYYTIEGYELAKGEISFINGMGLAIGGAVQDARRIRDAHCPGAALHCVYAAQQGAWDFASAACGQALRILPQGKLLLQRWSEFFERAAPDENYLQICTSRGAIDTATALNVLPQHLKNRIVVLAIAPAYIIDKTLCPKAINFVIPEDTVPKLAPNYHLIGTDPCVKVLARHSDGSDPHDPHGSSYWAAVNPYVRQYLETNTI